MPDSKQPGRDVALEKPWKRLRKHYRWVMTGLFVLTLAMFAVDIRYPGLARLSEQQALMSKSLMIILFLSVTPLVLSYLRKRLKKVPRDTDLRDKMTVYRRHFQIKAAVISCLCLMSMVVFILSGDPMILVLLVAGLFFLYFERPNHLKFRTEMEHEEEA